MSFAPALPSPRRLGWRSIVFFPEYHLKWQGLFHKGRSGTTLICMGSTLAQLFLRLLNYSQGTQCELLWGSGIEHCVQVLRLCTAQLGGRVLLTQTSVCTNCMTCRWVALLQNLGHSGRHPGKPWPVLPGFLYSHESNMLQHSCQLSP